MESKKYQEAVGALVRAAVTEASVVGASLWVKIQRDLEEHPQGFHRLAVVGELYRIADSLMEEVTDENDRIVVELIRKHGVFSVFNEEEEEGDGDEG